jgi:hypothetical protein
MPNDTKVIDKQPGEYFIKDPSPVILRKPTPINLLERICLFFIPTVICYDRLNFTTMVYKNFRGKNYIINHFVSGPETWNCRCSQVYLETDPPKL